MGTDLFFKKSGMSSEYLLTPYMGTQSVAIRNHERTGRLIKYTVPGIPVPGIQKFQGGK